MKKLLPLLSILMITACGQEIQINDLDNSQVSTLTNRNTRRLNNSFRTATYDIKDFSNKKDSKSQLNLSNAIHKLKADIISFQEVSSVKDFKTFTDKYLADMNYKFYSSQDVGSKVNSVVLTRFNVENLQKVTAVKNKYPLNTLFKMQIIVNPNYSFKFYTSFVPTSEAYGYTQAKRDADIEEMKAYILSNQKADFKEQYLIVGNLNGSPTQRDMQTIIDPRSSFLSFHDIVTEDIGSGEEIFSQESKNVKSRPDYILVSPGMFDDYVYNSITIHNKSEDKLYKEFSDHYPLTADFNLPAQ